VAHILVDTRCAGTRGWKPHSSIQAGRKKESKRQTKKEKFWDSLPIELQKELKAMMEER
jgi:hypothetical protein